MKEKLLSIRGASGSPLINIAILFDLTKSSILVLNCESIDDDSFVFLFSTDDELKRVEIKRTEEHC